MNYHTAVSLYKRYSADKLYYWIFALIITAGFILRISQLGDNDLWIDEAFTGFLALSRDILGYLRVDNNPPLYYLLQKGWCSVVTCNEYGLRLTSVLAGTLFIILIGSFCRQLYGNKISLAIALLAAVSPLNFYYSQEARVYSILLTVLLLFLYLQWQVIWNKATASRLLLLFITSTVALYLHFFSLIVICACLLIYGIGAASGRRRIPASYFIAVFCSLLAFVPWMYMSVFSSNSTSSEMQWIAEYLADKPLWQLPVRSITTFLVGIQVYNNEINLFVKRYATFDSGLLFHLFYSFLAVLFFCLYVTSLARVKLYSRKTQLFLLEMSGLVILPLFALVAVSLTYEPAYVVGRYDLIAYPAFLLLTACMLHILTGKHDNAYKWSNAAVITLFVLLIGTATLRDIAYLSTPPYKGMKSDVTVVLDTVHNGDGLLVANPDAILVWYYLQAHGINRTGDVCVGPHKHFICRLFPEDMEQAPALQERYARLYKDPKWSSNVGYFLNDLTSNSRIELLLRKIDINRGKMSLTPVGYRLVETLLHDGYKIERIIARNDLIIFDRNKVHS